MTNGEVIRERYMQDNDNMAEYFMCIECPEEEQCCESPDEMRVICEKCKESYEKWLKFLNTEYNL